MGGTRLLRALLLCSTFGGAAMAGCADDPPAQPADREFPPRWTAIMQELSQNDLTRAAASVDRLTALCREWTDAPCDDGLQALWPYMDMEGPRYIRDYDVRSRFMEAYNEIAGLRCARHGHLVARPADLDTMTSGDLLSAAMHLTDAAFAGSEAAERDRLLAGLSVGQRAVFTTNWYLVLSNNGGFQYFFEMHPGSFVREAVAGMRLVGADALAGRLERALSLFPEGVLPEDHDARMAVIDAAPLDRLERLEGDLYGEGPGSNADLERRLASFIRKHPDEFFER